MKKRIEYNINICPLESFPVCLKISKKEFYRFINTYGIQNTEKVILWDTIEEYRYKYEKDDVKIILVKTVLK